MSFLLVGTAPNCAASVKVRLNVLWEYEAYGHQTTPECVYGGGGGGVVLGISLVCP